MTNTVVDPRKINLAVRSLHALIEKFAASPPHKVVRGKNQPGRRWTPSEEKEAKTFGEDLLRSKRRGNPPTHIAREVHLMFAGVCQKHGLEGLPAQSEGWYRHCVAPAKKFGYCR